MAHSYKTYLGDGETSTFTVTFPYIDTSHVKAYLDGVEIPFTWATSTTITFASPPALGVVIVIVRTTPADARLVNYVNGSLLDEATLDLDANQLFFAAQEAIDDMENAIKADPTDLKYDADSTVIKNLGTPENANDACTKGYIDTTWTDYMDAAVLAAETAQGLAESAETGAVTARGLAETAETGAVTAEGKAEKWADEDEDVTVETGKYSAKHWSAKAENYVSRATRLPSALTDDAYQMLMVNAEETAYEHIDMGTVRKQKAQFHYKDTDEIYIDAGRYYLYGVGWVYWNAQLTFQFTGLVADTWYAVYIDKSAVDTLGSRNITASQLIASTSIPTKSNTKGGGYYNGDDLCIGVFKTKESLAELIEFYNAKSGEIEWTEGITIQSPTNIGLTWADASPLLLPPCCTAGCLMVRGSYVSEYGPFLWRPKGVSASKGREIIYVASSNNQSRATIWVNTGSDTNHPYIQLIESHGMASTIGIDQLGYAFPIGM